MMDQELVPDTTLPGFNKTSIPLKTNKKNRTFVTPEQRELMVNFIIENPEMITNSCTKNNKRELWKELNIKLNNLKPEKSLHNWKTIWSRWLKSLFSKPESSLMILDWKLKSFLNKIMYKKEEMYQEETVKTVQEEKKILTFEEKMQLSLEENKQLLLEKNKQLSLKLNKQLSSKNNKQSSLEKNKELSFENNKQSSHEENKQLSLEDNKQLPSLEGNKQLSLEENKKLSSLKENKQLSFKNNKQSSLKENKQLSSLKENKQLSFENNKQSSFKENKQLSLENNKQLQIEENKQFATEKMNQFTIEEIDSYIKDVEKEKSRLHLEVDDNDFKILKYTNVIKSLESENVKKRKWIKKLNDRKYFLNKKRKIIYEKTTNNQELEIQNLKN